MQIELVSQKHIPQNHRSHPFELQPQPAFKNPTKRINQINPSYKSAMAPSQSSSIRLQSPRELKAMIFWGSSLKASLKSSMAPWKSPWSFRSSPRLLMFWNKHGDFFLFEEGKNEEKIKRSWCNKKKAGTWEKLKHTNWLITSFLGETNHKV